MTNHPILIVEDNDCIRETLKEVLEIEGYPVETAVDGKEVLERLKQLPLPSLILLDLMLPNISGWQVLEEIKKDIKDPATLIPVVITSAAGDAVATTAQKADGYLKKPIHLDLLLQTVEHYCGPGTPSQDH